MRDRRRVTPLRALLVVPLCALACVRPAGGVRADVPTGDAPPTTPLTAFAVDSALRLIASAPLWPHFQPLRIPVAMFDGVRTYLFRHPRPPAEYVAVSGSSDVVVREGRDPAITANTSAQLGGVATATVMLDSRANAPDVAALTVHELFHVFQRARHPSWQANEADQLTYPVEDTTALALRREESSALRRALAAPSTDSMRCWGRAFVDARVRRFAALGTAAAAYERGTELNEGLAQYVERRAAGRRVTLATSDAPAAQVRQRAYAVGAALAAVLDRADPGWREVLEGATATAVRPLDAILADAIRSGTEPRACVPTGAQQADWATQAGHDVRALIAGRERARSEYLARPGWRLVVEARDAPLFPAGFDPLNVTRLSATEILHTRFLELQGSLGSLALLGGTALTEGAAGAHPLFAGVRRVTITGVAAPFTVRDSAGTLAIDARGISGRLRGMRADTTGEMIRLTRR